MDSNTETTLKRFNCYVCNSKLLECTATSKIRNTKKQLVPGRKINQISRYVIQALACCPAARICAVVVFLWYKTMHSILKTKSSHNYGKIWTKIITASVRHKPDPRKKFSPPVRISWNTQSGN